MSANPLADLSQAMQAAVAAASAFTVSVRGRRRVPSSGVAWREGVVITAAHTLELEEGLEVATGPGQALAAEIAGADAGSDVAVLRVPGISLPAPEPGAEPEVGALTLSVARPGGEASASLGLLSARGGAWRAGRGPSVAGFLRTDATMFPGFSGGPLVDVEGHVLGLNTSLYARGGGFAIPYAAVVPIAEALLAHGRLRRAFLGVASQPTPLADELAVAAGQESGLLVVGVDADGPAQRAGLLVGDIMISLAGAAVRDTADLFDALHADLIGATEELAILRGGERRVLQITPAEREAEGAGP